MLAVAEHVSWLLLEAPIQVLVPSFLPMQVSLGYSTSETGAAQVYDREALRLRGSAAQLNFPHWSLSDAAAAASAPVPEAQVGQSSGGEVPACVWSLTKHAHHVSPCTVRSW